MYGHPHHPFLHFLLCLQVDLKNSAQCVSNMNKTTCMHIHVLEQRQNASSHKKGITKLNLAQVKIRWRFLNSFFFSFDGKTRTVTHGSSLEPQEKKKGNVLKAVIMLRTNPLHVTMSACCLRASAVSKCDLCSNRGPQLERHWPLKTCFPPSPVADICQVVKCVSVQCLNHCSRFCRLICPNLNHMSLTNSTVQKF